VDVTQVLPTVITRPPVPRTGVPADEWTAFGVLLIATGSMLIISSELSYRRRRLHRS
jgi:hypothetical protein